MSKDTSYPHEVLHNWWGNGFLRDLATDQPLFRLGTDRRLLGLPEGEYAGEDFTVALVCGWGGQPVGWAQVAIPARAP